MDLWDVLKLLVRRWRATVPLLVVALGAATWIGATSKPDYVATSYLTLLPPTVREDAASKRNINPWTVDTLMGVVVTRLNSKSQHDQLGAEGLSPVWLATTDYNFRQQLSLEVTADSAEKARATTRRLHEIAIEEVATQQARYQLGPGEEITAVEFDGGDNVATAHKKIYRLMIVVVGAGIILTMGLVIALDAVLRWRSNRQATGRTLLAAQPDKHGVARVDDSLVAAPVPTKPEKARQTDDPAVARPSPNSGVNSANDASDETTLLPIRRNGEVAPAVVLEYRVSAADSTSRSGAGTGTVSGEIQSEPTDATIVLPLSNAARAGRDEQHEGRDR